MHRVNYPFDSLKPFSGRVPFSQRPESRKHAFAAAVYVGKLNHQASFVDSELSQYFSRAYAKADWRVAQRKGINLFFRQIEQFVSGVAFNRNSLVVSHRL
jgi:hypothetical protein